jgi:prepilin-type processing-associated H-X9-DG protein
MPIYLCPAGSRDTDFLPFEKITVAFTYYLGVAGGEQQNDGILFFDGTVQFLDITDGTSQTVMVGERPPSPDLYLGWWYAGIGQRFDSSADFILLARQWNYTPRAPTCPPGPYFFGLGTPTNLCDTFHFWSLHPGGANFLFADGSVRFLSYEVAPILPALATRAGGETVAIDY